MKTAILIPARYASTRYPGKPLVKLKLPNGEEKSLIQLSWEAALQVETADETHVVTDDRRIADAARAFGASVVMTSTDCENGTARCAEALQNADIDADIIVNFQGDAPLTPPWFVGALITHMKASPNASMATPVLRCDAETYSQFVEDRKSGQVGGTTVVFDSSGHALYFSKEIVPYLPQSRVGDPPVFHHVGVYAFSRAGLAKYRTWPEGALEKLEGLEQLRFLENGEAVACIEVEARGRPFWELNNPGDVARLESAFALIETM